MFRDALSAVEQSTSLRVATSCEATDDNLANLRLWSADCDRQSPWGRRYGETATPDGRMFRGFDDDTGLDWCVFADEVRHD